MVRARTAPRVTVVIPTYNRAEWLSSSMAAVLGQTYHDFLLVVADNASDDDTGDVATGFDDERVTYLRRPTNVGLVENHNRCLAEIATEYVLIVPDDDVVGSELLATTVAVLDEQPSAGMVHAGFDLIGPFGELREADVDWTYGLTTQTVETGPEFIRRSMRWSCRVCASTALMRTAALPAGFFDPADFPAVDFGLWLRMALDWDMAFVPTTLGAYRVHGGSHSAAFGEPLEAGYVQDVQMVRRLREVKARFCEAYADRLEDVDELRMIADAAMRHELVVMARNRTLPDRRFAQTAGALWRGLKVTPSLVRDADAWRLLAGSVAGPRMVDRLRGRVVRA